MSQENVEIVRRVYEAISKQDTATVLDIYDPAVVWDFTPSPFAPMLERTVYEGHEGIKALLRERRAEAWETVSDDLDELIEAGDAVIAVVTSRGRGRLSGVETSMTHAAVWTIRDQKVLRVVWFGTRSEALKAAKPAE